MLVWRRATTSGGRRRKRGNRGGDHLSLGGRHPGCRCPGRHVQWSNRLSSPPNLGLALRSPREERPQFRF